MSKSSKFRKVPIEKKTVHDKVELDVVDEELKNTYRKIIEKYRRLYIDDEAAGSSKISSKGNDDCEMSDALDIEVNQEKKKIDFPITLTSAERKVIHQVCEEFSLPHQSSGKGKNRKVTVFFSKVNAEDESSSDKETKDRDGCAPCESDLGYDNVQTDPIQSLDNHDDQKACSVNDSFLPNNGNRYNDLEDCVEGLLFFRYAFVAFYIKSSLNLCQCSNFQKPWLLGLTAFNENQTSY